LRLRAHLRTALAAVKRKTYDYKAGPRCFPWFIRPARSAACRRPVIDIEVAHVELGIEAAVAGEVDGHRVQQVFA